MEANSNLKTRTAYLGYGESKKHQAETQIKQTRDLTNIYHSNATPKQDKNNSTAKQNPNHAHNTPQQINNKAIRNNTNEAFFLLLQHKKNQVHLRTKKTKIQ